MAHASDAFLRAATADATDPTGTVRLSVAELMGIEVLPPMLARLAQRHPGIAIELDLSNDSADLVEQQVDVAVRMHPPQQGALVAKKVATIDLKLYAHASYLQQHGEPRSLDDLKQHRFIGPDRSRPDLAIAAAKLPAVERSNVTLRTDSHPAVLAAARAGLGIAVLHQPIGDADPDLRPVLPDLVVLSLDTWIVTHENLRNVPRVRAVFDHLAAEVAAYAAT